MSIQYMIVAQIVKKKAKEKKCKEQQQLFDESFARYTQRKKLKTQEYIYYGGMR